MGQKMDGYTWCLRSHPTPPQSQSAQFQRTDDEKESKTYLYTFLYVVKRKKLFNINDGNGFSRSLSLSYFLNVYVFMHSYIAIRLYSPCPFRYSHIAQMNATFPKLFFSPFSPIFMHIVIVVALFHLARSHPLSLSLSLRCQMMLSMW